MSYQQFATTDDNITIDLPTVYTSANHLQDAQRHQRQSPPTSRFSNHLFTLISRSVLVLFVQLPAFFIVLHLLGVDVSLRRLDELTNAKGLWSALVWCVRSYYYYYKGPVLLSILAMIAVVYSVIKFNIMRWLLDALNRSKRAYRRCLKTSQVDNKPKHIVKTTNNNKPLPKNNNNNTNQLGLCPSEQLLI